MPNSFRRLVVFGLLLVILVTACDNSGTTPQNSRAQPATESAGPHLEVDAARIIAADQEPGNWLSHGRTYDEQRFSPLTGINAGNAAELGLEWFYVFDTHRGLEATPIVVRAG